MTCTCNPTYDDYFNPFGFLSDKEDQKAKVEAQPVLNKSFEDRVLSLAGRVWRQSPIGSIGYTWSQALSDATDIVLASEFECSIEEITND